MGEFFKEVVVPGTDEEIIESYYIPTDGKESRKDEIARVKTIRKQVSQICELVATLIDEGHPAKSFFESQEFVSLQDNIAGLRETLFEAVNIARAGSLIRTTHMINMIHDEFEKYIDAYKGYGDDRDEFRNVVEKISESVHDLAAVKLHEKPGYYDNLILLNERAYQTLEDKYFLEAMVELKLEENEKLRTEIEEQHCGDKCSIDDCSLARCRYYDIRNSADTKVKALSRIKDYMGSVLRDNPNDINIETQIKLVGNDEFKKVATRMLTNDGATCRYALAGRDKRQLLNTSEKYVREQINRFYQYPGADDDVCEEKRIQHKDAYKLALERMMKFDFSKCGYDRVLKKDAELNTGEMAIKDEYGFFGGQMVGEQKESGQEKNED